MNRSPLGLATALLSGAIFGLGLAIAQMTDPQKIKNFLDFAAIPAGGWDPSLAFVMGGGAVVFFIGYRVANLLRKPLAAPAFSRPDRVVIDRPLVIGSTLFGIGWGISGFCPGPAIANFGLVPADVVLFVAAMLVGSWAVGFFGESSTSASSANARPA
jgi:uncharacterized membrane protein YedE/YeeE